MTRFTIFTKLPIGEDKDYTPITGKKISEIPLGFVYGDKDELLSQCWEDGYFLKTSLVTDEGLSVVVVESDTGWCVQYDDTQVRVRIIESDDGSWKKFRLCDKEHNKTLGVLEQCVPEFGHYVHIEKDEKTTSRLRYNVDTKTYEFDVGVFIEDKSNIATDTVDELKVAYDVGSATLIGKKQELVQSIDYLIKELSQVKDSILGDGY